MGCSFQLFCSSLSFFQYWHQLQRTLHSGKYSLLIPTAKDTPLPPVERGLLFSRIGRDTNDFSCTLNRKGGTPPGGGRQGPHSGSPCTLHRKVGTTGTAGPSGSRTAALPAPLTAKGTPCSAGPSEGYAAALPASLTIRGYPVTTRDIRGRTAAPPASYTAEGVPLFFYSLKYKNRAYQAGICCSTRHGFFCFFTVTLTDYTCLFSELAAEIPKPSPSCIRSRSIR